MASFADKLKANQAKVQAAKNPEISSKLALESARGKRDVTNRTSSRDRRAATRDIKHETQRQESSVERLNADFGRLAQGTPDEVKDWKGIAEAAIYASQSDDSKDLVTALLQQYGDEIKPHIAAAGADDAWWESNYVAPEEAKGPGGVLGFVGAVGDYADQWGQESLNALGGIRGAIDPNDNVSIKEGLQHALRKGATALDITRAIPGDLSLSSGLEFSGDELGQIRKDDGSVVTFDQGGGGGGEGRLNFREVLGLDVEMGGNWGGALDLMATMFVDPTSWVTMGQSNMAKLGLKVARETAEGMVAAKLLQGEKNLMPLIEQAIRRGGRDSLTQVEDDFMVQMMTRGAHAATGNKEKALKNLDKQLTAITRSAGDGINFLGYKVIPTHRLTEVLRRAGIATNSVFRRVPINVAKLSDDAAVQVANELASGPVWPALGQGDQSGRFLPDVVGQADETGWEFYEDLGQLVDEGGDYVNVTNPAGDIARIRETDMQIIFEGLADFDLAIILRENPQLLKALPPGRRRVVSKLVKGEVWEDGLDGLIRRSTDVMHDTVDGIAGELPPGRAPYTSRASAARRQRVSDNTRNLPRYGPGSTARPHAVRGAITDIVPFTGRETNAGLRGAADEVGSLPFTYGAGELGGRAGRSIDDLLQNQPGGQVDDVFARGDDLGRAAGANLQPDEFFDPIMDVAGDVSRAGGNGWDIVDETVKGTDIVPSRGSDIVPFKGSKGGDIVPFEKAAKISDELMEEGDRVLKELDELGEAPISPELQRAIDNVTYNIILDEFKGGLWAKIMDRPKLNTLIKNMNPRSFITARFSKPTADKFGSMLSRMGIKGEQAFDDVMLRTGVSTHRAAKDLRQTIKLAGGQEELFRILDGALSGGREAFEQALIDNADNPGLVRMLKALDETRMDTLRQVLRGKGHTWAEVDELMENLDIGVDGYSERLGRKLGIEDMPENLHDINTYMPRVLTGAIRDDASKLAKIKAAGGDGSGMTARDSADTVTEGFLNKRGGLASADSVFGANSEAAELFRQAGIGDITEVFEQNPIVANAVRAKSGYKAAAEVQVLDDMTELALPGGAKAAYRVTPEQLAAQKSTKLGQEKFLPPGANLSDYRKVDMESGVHYFVEATFADELENLRKIFGNPKEVDEIGKFLDKANNVWAMQATVGLVNPGFHARNTVGNWFNMVLGGVRDPRLLPQAGVLQNKNRKILNEQANSGLTYAQAAAKIGVDGDDLKILLGAKEHGVLADGRTLDLSRVKGGQAKESGGADLLQSRSAKLGSDGKLDISSPDSMLNRPGIIAGEAVEGNARLAMYMDQINKGASPIAASDHVKKYLFDYGDLTRFENEKVRRVSRFYTFARKNTALQFYGLTRHPGLTRNTQKAVEGTVEAVVGGGADEDGPRGPDWMRNPIKGVLGGQQVAATVDTPLDSFAEMTELVTGFFEENDPLKPGEHWTKRLVDNLDSLMAGAPISFVDFLQETSTGIDSFSGRPLAPPGTMKDGEDVGEVRDSAWFRLADVFFPSASRAERWVAQGVGSPLGLEARGGRDERNNMMNFANIIFGITVAKLGEDASGNQRSVLMRQLTDAADGLRDKYGAYDADTNPDGVRSLTEMRKMGELGTKDRVAQAIMYAWRKDENGELVWDDAVRDKKLLDIVPKDVLRAFGVPAELLDEHEGSGAANRPKLDKDDVEGQAKYDEQDLNAGIAAYEEWRGEPLTEEEKMDFIIASPWGPSNEMLEGLGIEAYHDTNRFVPGEEKPSYDVKLGDANAVLTRLAESQGLSPDAFAAYRPVLSKTQRIINEAAAAGVPRSELIDYIVRAKDEGGGGVLTRNDKAFINQLLGFGRADGPVPLTTERFPDVTDEDERKIQRRAWEAQQEFILTMQVMGLPAPSTEQIETYVMNSVMNGRTLDELGILNLKGAPRRDDGRTDAEKFEDSLAVQRGAERGILSGPVG